MATKDNDYYVYVYIDPRNFEPFYYGKGRGSRKDAHKPSDKTRKTKRIRDIRTANEKPIIRVIACGLTEEQAMLVETTLIWQADRRTLNEVAGHFQKRFRPLRSMHRELSGFDSQRRVHFFNVGDGSSRTWEDNLKYGYVGAGHGRRFRQAIEGLREGDIIAAYISRHGRGFVGIGRVTAQAKPAREFRIGRKLLIDIPNMPRRIAENLNRDDMCEWMAAVDWIKSVPRTKAYFKKNAGIFIPRNVRASLAKHTRTVNFIENSFKVDLLKVANE
jgi:uncharacterized protein